MYFLSSIWFRLFCDNCEEVTQSRHSERKALGNYFTQNLTYRTEWPATCFQPPPFFSFAYFYSTLGPFSSQLLCQLVKLMSSFATIKPSQAVEKGGWLLFLGVSFLLLPSLATATAFVYSATGETLYQTSSTQWGADGDCLNSGFTRGICSSDETKRCDGHAWEMYCSADPLTSVHDELIFEYSSSWGSWLTCNTGYAQIGMCASGKNKDCNDYNSPIGIKCGQPIWRASILEDDYVFECCVRGDDWYVIRISLPLCDICFTDTSFDFRFCSYCPEGAWIHQLLSDATFWKVQGHSQGGHCCLEGRLRKGD